MALKPPPPERKCSQCNRWNLVETGNCLLHSPQFICEHAKCSNQKENGLNFCREHAPKNAKGEAIGLGPLKLSTMQEVIDAYADTFNRVREGSFSAAQGTTLSTLLNRLHEAYSDQEKANPKNIFTKALAGEAARNIGAKMTLEEAMQIAKNRSPHLVAKAIEDNAILEAVVIREKVERELDDKDLDRLLGDDV